MRTTQRERILGYLRSNGKATVHELMVAAITNNPHARIEEMTDDGGLVYEPIRDGWVCTGERIVRDSMRHNGRKITVFRIKRA